MEISPSEEENIVLQILREEKLEEFYQPLKSELRVYLLHHFEYVKLEELEKIGISKPAGRRLLHRIKNKQTTLRFKGLVNKFWNPIQSLVQGKSIPVEISDQPSSDSLSSECHFIFLEDLELISQIGTGSFGVVWKAKWTHPKTKEKIHVAAKVLKQEVLSNEVILTDLIKEAGSMRNLNHENLIRLWGVVVSESRKMIITELAEGGSLRDRLRKESGATSIALLHDFSIQIASGMSYLESERLIHRDLAARNILLTKTQRVKIGDFGLVRTLPGEEDHYVMNESKRVPFPWCAPESLRRREFSTHSDVWMFGVTLWEMFSFGSEPWKGLNGAQVVQKIDKEGERLPKPEACSKTLYGMLLKCWDAVPTKRPSFHDMKDFLLENRPTELLGEKFFDGTDETLPDSRLTIRASELFAQRKPLVIRPGDRIQLVEETPEFYLWKGQNQTSFDIGYFPRCITKGASRHNKKKAISRPLDGSFVHAAHGGLDTTWGNPDSIDKMYLENPMHPPDIMGFIDKELPPLPSKSDNQHKRFSSTDKSCQRNVPKKAGYSRFYNEERQALLQECLLDSIKRVKGKKKNANKVPPKRSLSCTQLKDEKMTCVEGLLIDFSGEEIVQEKSAASLMAREHATLTNPSVKFPESFEDDERKPIAKNYSNVNENNRYYSTPGEDEGASSDGGESFVSFADSEWARRAIPSVYSDSYSDVTHGLRRSSQPNLSSDGTPSLPSLDDPFNTSFVDKYTAAYEASNTIEKRLEEIDITTPSNSSAMTQPKPTSSLQHFFKTQPPELSTILNNEQKPKPAKLDMNLIKQLESKIFVNPAPQLNTPLVKPPPSTSSNRRSRDQRSDITSHSDTDPSRKSISPPTAHVRPILSANKGPAPPPPPQQPFFPFSGPSAPAREIVYGLSYIGPSPDLNIKVDKLMENVKGANREECLRALMTQKGDIVAAMKELKINELMKLGIADIGRCTQYLEESEWNLDVAASKCFE